MTLPYFFSEGQEDWIAFFLRAIVAGIFGIGHSLKKQ
jgi:hypothetical protein